MRIEIRPKDGVDIIGEILKDGTLWHLVAYDEQENEIDIILDRKDALDLKRQLKRSDLK